MVPRPPSLHVAAGLSPKFDTKRGRAWRYHFDRLSHPSWYEHSLTPPSPVRRRRIPMNTVSGTLSRTGPATSTPWLSVRPRPPPAVANALVIRSPAARALPMPTRRFVTPRGLCRAGTTKPPYRRADQIATPATLFRRRALSFSS